MASLDAKGRPSMQTPPARSHRVPEGKSKRPRYTQRTRREVARVYPVSPADHCSKKETPTADLSSYSLCSLSRPLTGGHCQLKALRPLAGRGSRGVASWMAPASATLLPQ